MADLVVLSIVVNTEAKLFLLHTEYAQWFNTCKTTGIVVWKLVSKTVERKLVKSCIRKQKEMQDIRITLHLVCYFLVEQKSQTKTHDLSVYRVYSSIY